MLKYVYTFFIRGYSRRWGPHTSVILEPTRLYTIEYLFDSILVCVIRIHAVCRMYSEWSDIGGSKRLVCVLECSSTPCRLETSAERYTRRVKGIGKLVKTGSEYVRSDEYG